MKKNILIILLVILALSLPLFTGTYLLHVFTSIIIFLSLALSWDMMLRTGQLSFGTAGFFGLGAYASVLIVAKLGFNPIMSLLIGAIFSAVIAFGLGFIVLRLREIYFAITTLALTHVFSVIIRNLSDLTGGSSGTQLNNAIFDGDPIKIYYLVLTVGLLVIVLSEVFKRSRIHFAINSIRNDETTAKSSGIDVFKYLLFVFVITSAIQGLVGAVYAQQYAFVNPESTFSLNFLLLPIAMALVGGIYSTNGPIIGALILGLISEYLKLIMPYGHLIVYGVIIVFVVLFLPQGVYKPIKDKFLKSSIVGGIVMPTLKANNILKRFGGLIAVNDLSFSVEKGEVLGIIGPNGAGKTTVINLMAGTLQVNKGKIIFNDEDVTNNPAHIRNRKGISRTFQIVRPLEDFTAIENIMVGALFGKGDKLPEARKKAEEICEFLNIKNVNKHVDELTVLELKKIELGRALAADPELLFLDEIMAGLNSEETWELIDIIKKLQKRNIAICLVEHIMKVVKELTQRVIVLDRGQIIAQGPYSKVSEKQEVIAAYLGEDD